MATGIKRAKGRSLKDFGKLSAAERKLLKACAEGEPCALSGTRPEVPTPGNAIRADLVRFLALGGDELHPAHEKGVQLFGAWIQGKLDLNFCDCPVPLLLLNCYFEQAVSIIDTRLVCISLNDSKLPAFAADRVRCRGFVNLGRLIASGEVKLSGAEIGGDLSCRGAHLSNSSGYALLCDGIQVSGSVVLDDQFLADGEARFVNAKIGRNLSCGNSKFNNKDGIALSCDGITVHESVLLNKSTIVNGEVRLVGADIGGNLECHGAQMKRLGGDVLVCDGMHVAGSAFLNQNFIADGVVRLCGADIGGSLYFSGSNLTNPNGFALLCKGMKVSRDVLMDGGFEGDGVVSFQSVEIGGQFSCRGASIKNSNNYALLCDGLKVKGEVFLDEKLRITGELRLVGAEIDGNLSLRKASLTNWEGDALICERAKVRGTVFLDQDFKADGNVDLIGAHFATLVDKVHLSSSSLLVLDGFTYDRIMGDASTNAEERVRWLQRQPAKHLNEDFRPQPWEQLIKVLREMGHLEEARKVAIAKQDALRKAGKTGGAVPTFLHRLYGQLAGYGYLPMRTVTAMTTVWLLCTVLFWMASDLGLMGPTSPIVTADPTITSVCGVGDSFRETQWTACAALPQEYTTFNPWLYSLDLILPLVDLQQEADWAPIVTKDDGVTTIWAGSGFRFLMWFEILFGWAMSLLLVAVLGNLVKKD